MAHPIASPLFLICRSPGLFWKVIYPETGDISSTFSFSLTCQFLSQPPFVAKMATYPDLAKETYRDICWELWGTFFFPA